MKKAIRASLGSSWKTTLISYVLAVMIALQPLLNEEIDWGRRSQLVRYIVRLFFAAGVAVFGKYAADSSQVHKVEQQQNAEPL